MTMIASMLHLNRKDIKALRITDPYSLHRVVYSLYEDNRNVSEKINSKSSGILFADQGGDINGRRILMLSDRSPAEKIDDQFGRIQSKHISEDFLDHTNYRFKVIVNPTSRNKASRKLVAIKGREAVSTWFSDRALSTWGFAVSQENLQVDKIDVLRFKNKDQHEITISQAHVQGILTLVDPIRFRRSFKEGIGRARAFGCGLLQVVPIN